MRGWCGVNPFDLPIFDRPLVIFAVALVVVAGAIVQSGLGMGFGLMAAPLLALIDPSLVPAPALFISLVTGLVVACRERAGIVWPEVGIGAFGRLIGVVAGTVLLARIGDGKMFQLVFGLLIGLAVVLSAGGWRLAFSWRSLNAMGVVSGLMGTITSVGAPPLAIIYQDRDPRTARPTLAAFFAAGCALSLLGLAVAGLTGWRDLMLGVLMLPPMIVGFLLAGLFRGRFDRGYRPALLAIAGFAALGLIWRGLA